MKPLVEKPRDAYELARDAYVKSEKARKQWHSQYYKDEESERE